MDKIRLNNIFENIVNGYSIDFAQAPNLYSIINTPNSSGQRMATTDDFLKLLNNSPAASSVISYILDSNAKKIYNDKIAVYRVYNLYKFIHNTLATQSSTLSPGDKSMYEDAMDEFIDICKTLRINHNTRKSTFSINQTDQLKNNLFYLDANQRQVRINEVDFETFLDQNDPVANKYYDAIIGGNLDLPFDDSSAAGKIYMLYRGIHKNCQSTMIAYANMMDKMKTLNKGADGKENGKFGTTKTPLVSVQSLDVINTQDRTDIQLTYKLYRTDNNKPFRHETYTGLYTYYDTKWSYEFVNNRDKNNHFSFVRPVPQDYIHVGSFYNIQYDDSKLAATVKKKLLKIVFSEIKTTVKSGGSQDFSQFIHCKALNELLEVLHHLRT